MLPPEIIRTELKSKYKIQFYVDDPHSTLSYGTPYAFAFDAAVYISKNYSEHSSMLQFLNYVGFSKRHIYYLPLCASIECLSIFPQQRSCWGSGAVYIGIQYYGSKAGRLKFLKRNLKDDFKVYGRWPLKGIYPYFRSSKVKTILFSCSFSIIGDGNKYIFNQL